MVRPLPRFVRGSSATPPGRLRTIRGLFFLSTAHRCRTTVPGRSVGGLEGALAPRSQILKSKIQTLRWGSPLPQFSNIGFPCTHTTVFKYWVPSVLHRRLDFSNSVLPRRLDRHTPKQVFTHSKRKGGAFRLPPFRTVMCRISLCLA